jgi:hypothetical protein
MKNIFSASRLRFALATAAALVAVVAFMPSVTHASAPTGFTSKTYSDANNNGTVDTVTVVINGGEALTTCTVTSGELATDWTYVGNSIGGTLASATCDTATATITFTITGATAGITGGGTAPTIAYDDDDGDHSIDNATGDLGTVAAASITDAAKPVIKTVKIEDTDVDGLIDKLTYTWTENIDTDNGAAPVSADLPTTLLPDGSTATFGSATISDPAGASAVVTVTGVTGQAAVNTAAGSTAISGDLSAKWVDGATNAPHATGATANESITDAAVPIVVTVTPTDASTDQSIGDDLVVVFSEPMDTTSLTVATDPTTDITQTWSNSDKTVNLAHTYFDHSTSVTTTITAAEAVAGTATTLDGLPYDWTFTTFAAHEGSGGGGSSSSHSNSDHTTNTPGTNGNMPAQIAALLAQVAALQAQLGHGSTGIGAGVSAFARDLDMGATGDDVHGLQVYLNTHGFQVASTGPGAPGSETSLFGGLTKAALAKFQASVGITPAVGYFGPLTRAYVQAHP